MNVRYLDKDEPNHSLVRRRYGLNSTNRPCSSTSGEDYVITSAHVFDFISCFAFVPGFFFACNPWWQTNTKFAIRLPVQVAKYELWREDCKLNFMAYSSGRSSIASLDSLLRNPYSTLRFCSFHVISASIRQQLKGNITQALRLSPFLHFIISR